MSLAVFNVPAGDIRYPTALAAIHDPPPTLWIKGQIEALRAPSVAIVGSRAASPYALEVSRRLGADLARRGMTVVSGMARGVDSAAHRGALEAGGVTVAVFGCGVDIIYPREHKALADRICERGALVSEFPPGTPPLKPNFPQRNRIISGLSLAVVVVEAAEGQRLADHCRLRARAGARRCSRCRETCWAGATTARTPSCATEQS